MSQYITRKYPVVTGIAYTNLNEGQVVLGDANGILYAITSSTDCALGVVASVENAVDGINNSGSVINVIVASPVFRVKCDGAVSKFAGLIATGSTGLFKTGAYYMGVSGSQSSSYVATPESFFNKYNAIALSAGVANDIIPAVLPWK